jgi:hypothetical protein
MPVVVAGFDEVRELVGRLVERLRALAEQIVSDGIGAVRALPGFLADPVIALAEEFAGIVRRLLDAVDRLTEPAGRPAVVWETGRRWVAEVAGPLSAHISKIDPDHLAAGYEWDGRAAEAYEAAAARQRESLAALQGVGADVDAALGRLAIGICGLWAALAAALASAIVQLIGAAVAVGTGVGTPAGFMFATTSVATACAAVAGGAAAMAALVEWVSDSIGAVRDRLYDNSAYPDGGWPMPAVTRFADGSMTDGTPTDWHLPD